MATFNNSNADDDEKLSDITVSFHLVGVGHKKRSDIKMQKNYE